MPRMLRGVSHRSMSTSTLGCKVSAPFGLGKYLASIILIIIINRSNFYLLLIFASLTISLIDFFCMKAPSAMQRMAHPDGEVAAAKGSYMFII